jgi:hypothetical protein
MKRICILLSVLIMVTTISASSHGALIDMQDGTIYDTDTQLSWLKDARAGGYTKWVDARAWTQSLNIAGLTGWRLPAADPACGVNYNCAASEMGHLYYAELGNAAGEQLTNTGPFVNLQSGIYWTGTEYVTVPKQAWGFSFLGGSQYADDKENHCHAWAVRPGARSVEPPASDGSGQQPPQAK